MKYTFLLFLSSLLLKDMTVEENYLEQYFSFLKNNIQCNYVQECIKESIKVACNS